jgi:HK97 family phage portal protein
LGFKELVKWYKGDSGQKAVAVADNTTVHPRSSMFTLTIPGTKYDYAKEVGSGLGSNVIMSAVQWVMRTFPEAPVKLDKKLKDGETEEIFAHPFLDLIDEPNPFYSYEALTMASMLSYNISGNAYWYKVRNALGQVIQLWYLPHWLVSAKGGEHDPTVFISHYEYNPNGMVVIIPPEDIVHYRFGIDPRNVRHGLSPLDAVIREVYTDDQASNYSASILRNMGVPGVIMSPTENEGMSLEDAKVISEKFKTKFGGDNKGESMTMTVPMKIETFGFNTKDLALPEIRNISEERVCAALGIPPAVIGFGTGLETTKVGATMKAMIELAWNGNIIPTQKVFAKTMNRQLLVEFDNDKSLVVGYDNRDVQALQEDKSERVKRLGLGVTQGWAKVSDPREAEGLSVEDSDKVYLRTFAQMEVGEDTEEE